MRGSSGSPNRKNKPKNRSHTNLKILKKLKISGPNGLSKCLESREIDFGNCWEKYCFDNFLDDFLDPATKPRSQGFDPDLFMTELPCHQLGANIK